MLNRISTAIDNLKQIDPDYWNSTLAQRLPSGAGSIVTGFVAPGDLELALRYAHWSPYVHPDVMAGCTAFVSHSLGGHLGLVKLQSLPADTVVTLDDRKNTGSLSCTVRGMLGPVQDFVVIILGDGGGREIVYTFHPGAPVTPFFVAATQGLHDKKISVAEALSMGFQLAKIVA